MLSAYSSWHYDSSQHTVKIVVKSLNRVIPIADQDSRVILSQDGSMGDPAPGEDEAHGAVHHCGPQGRVHHRGPGQGLLHAVGAPAHGARANMVSQYYVVLCRV